MKRLSRRLWAVLLATAASALVVLAASHAAGPADSIVFIKNHNVWLAKANGSGQVRVTRDGTAANPYYSPTQADNGTIVALRGPDGRPRRHFQRRRIAVYRLSPSGSSWSAPDLPLRAPRAYRSARAQRGGLAERSHPRVWQLLYEEVSRGGRRKLKPVPQRRLHGRRLGAVPGQVRAPAPALGSPSWIHNRRLLIFDQSLRWALRYTWPRSAGSPSPSTGIPAAAISCPTGTESLGGGE